jgi:hypothetical protein
MGKHDVQRVCVVCGTKIPQLSRQELMDKGCMTATGSYGQYVFHCPYPIHSRLEIEKMIRATPLFHTGNDYRK